MAASDTVEQLAEGDAPRNEVASDMVEQVSAGKTLPNEKASETVQQVATADPSCEGGLSERGGGSVPTAGSAHSRAYMGLNFWFQ